MTKRIASKRALVLPIEVYKREFLGKLLLALHGASQDYEVYIFDQSTGAEKKIDSGFILYKDHAVCSELRVDRWKSKGFKVGVLDEEGIIYRSEELYLRNRVSEPLISKVDAVFAWGNTQQELLKRKLSCKSVIVGNPRFDVLKLFRKIKTNSSSLMVLVNTRFSSCNGLRSVSEEILNLKKLNVIKDQEELEKFLEFVREDRKIFEEFLLFVEAFAKIDNVKITVRPHPAENVSYYLEKFKSLSNVVVDNNTELAEQISMHDVVVQDGCTTAIEAAMQGRPVFGLRPSESELDYGELPNLFSQNFNDHLTLIEFLCAQDFKNYTPTVNYSKPENLIANWADDTSSVKGILRVVDASNVAPIKRELSNYKGSINTHILELVNKVPLFSSILSATRFSAALSILENYRITRSKFPDIKITEINRLVDLLCHLDDQLQSASQYEVEAVGTRVLRIRKR